LKPDEVKPTPTSATEQFYLLISTFLENVRTWWGDMRFRSWNRCNIKAMHSRVVITYPFKRLVSIGTAFRCIAFDISFNRRYRARVRILTDIFGWT
jgi:hypothetical protein